MQIRCPHCHQPIEVVDDDPSGDTICSSCGSAFNLAWDFETISDDGSQVRMLGHYHMLQHLGQGAFGSVWKARDTELDRTVAIKIPRREQVSGDDAEKFLREARAAAQVRHSNIVSVHEVGREDGQIYIASDFIEGASLDQWIEAHPPTVSETVELCAKIATALHHAHEAGVVHRDLKPQNILMDMSGEPHVTDFGLAKRDAGEVTMTVEGVVLGTPAYMPPEQARGEAHKADRRSDVYSLGVILYRLLTGELPFRGRSQMLIVQILKEEPPSPRKLDGRLPRDVETICLKCLEKDPARRYQTSAELAADLKRWLTGHPIIARRVGRMERGWRWCKRNPTIARLSAVVMLALLAGIVISTRFAIEASLEADFARSETDRADERTAAANVSADEARRHLKTSERNAYNSDMLLVQRDWEAANIDHLRELLDRHRDRDDIRGFEWGYWDRLAHSDLLTLKGHTSGVIGVAFSPDGTRLATASYDHTVKVWDAATGQKTLTLNGHTGSVNSVSFSPDGTRLASASYDRTVRVWDAATGQKTLTLKGHTSEVNSVSFSLDGTRLASASRDQTVQMWDAVTGQETLTLKGHTGSVNSVSFNPDGTRLASASYDKTAKVWDAATGQETLTLKGHTDSVTSVVFSADGTRLASASYDKTVKVWDPATGQETLTVKGHANWVDSVSFSPDGTWLASASSDQTVKVWNASTGQETHRLKGHSSEVRSVSFSPDGTRIASASGDGTVKLWDTSTGQEMLTLKGHTSAVYSVAFSPDGTRLASASEDGTVKIWDARPWTPELRAQSQARGLLTVHRDRVKSLEELQTHIRADQTISDIVRKQALDWAELFWKNRQPEQE